MTSDKKPEPLRPGEAETEQAERAVKKQAADAPPGDAKPDEGKRPDQLTTENDGGAQG